MTQPLALLVFQRVMPGRQLVNRLTDKAYRVKTLSQSADLLEVARQEKPLFVIVDLAAREKDVCPAIAALRQDPDTQHIPIIAIEDASDARLGITAREAGANLVVKEAAILMHLDPLIDQALQIE